MDRYLVGKCGDCSWRVGSRVVAYVSWPRFGAIWELAVFLGCEWSIRVSGMLMRGFVCVRVSNLLKDAKMWCSREPFEISTCDVWMTLRLQSQ